jgi:hypothetical protein
MLGYRVDTAGVRRFAIVFEQTGETMGSRLRLR